MIGLEYTEYFSAKTTQMKVNKPEYISSVLDVAQNFHKTLLIAIDLGSIYTLYIRITYDTTSQTYMYS